MLAKKMRGSSIKYLENAEVKNDEKDYEDYQDDIDSLRSMPDVDHQTKSKGKPLN